MKTNTKLQLLLLLSGGAVLGITSPACADPDRIAGVGPVNIIFAHNEQGGLRHIVGTTAGGFDCRGSGTWFTTVHGPASGTIATTVTAISPDGLVAVGWSLIAPGQAGSSPQPSSFTWTPCDGAGTIGQDIPGATGGQALGVSVGGNVVVGVAHGPRDAGFRLYAANAANLVLDFEFRYDTMLRGVSAAGDVVVGSGADALGRQALVFVDGWDHVRPLGDLLGGTSWSDAYAVSADGSAIVGQSMSASGPQAFMWNDNVGMFGLGDLPGGGFDSAALAVSANGQVVVGVSRSANGPQAFRWSAETGMIGLGDLPGGGFGSEALAVSADGSFIVGRSLTANGYEAFVWDHTNGMRNLRTVLSAAIQSDTVVPLLTAAHGISADGTVIGGAALTADGTAEGFVTRIPLPLCAADWNRDGVSNSLDYFAFLQAFFDHNADQNGDGITDTRDFFDFLRAFFEGCP